MKYSRKDIIKVQVVGSLYIHRLLHGKMKIKKKKTLFCVSLFSWSLFLYGWPGSSVGIATDYELDGPGLNSGGDEIFRPSRPTLGITQPPVKWIPGLSRG